MPAKRRLSGEDEEGGDKKKKKLDEPQQIQVFWFPRPGYRILDPFPRLLCAAMMYRAVLGI